MGGSSDTSYDEFYARLNSSDNPRNLRQIFEEDCHYAVRRESANLSYSPPPQPLYNRQPQPAYYPQPQPAYNHQLQSAFYPQQQPAYYPQQQPVYNHQPQPGYYPQPQPLYYPQPQPVYNHQAQTLYNHQAQPVYNHQAPPGYNHQAPPVYNHQPQPVYNHQAQSVYNLQAQPVYSHQPQSVYKLTPQRSSMQESITMETWSTVITKVTTGFNGNDNVERSGVAHAGAANSVSDSESVSTPSTQEVANAMDKSHQQPEANQTVVPLDNSTSEKPLAVQEQAIFALTKVVVNCPVDVEHGIDEKADTIPQTMCPLSISSPKTSQLNSADNTVSSTTDLADSEDELLELEQKVLNFKKENRALIKNIKLKEQEIEDLRATTNARCEQLRGEYNELKKQNTDLLASMTAQRTANFTINGCGDCPQYLNKLNLLEYRIAALQRSLIGYAMNGNTTAVAALPPEWRQACPIL
ncbi:altered inheritance of mitochondria protein 3-1-like [Drosophila busckii]|uniref:altered inheritance of mitochondria protein 3-1-like n=1 Tax=Drosophila busckii TaxID=30019 RepID=UPI00083E9EB5|nr:altered inheritance of mitochondria protein 3-1-like [Drosophila busckii]